MSNSLKSENLTISIPYEGCDKNCKYCISKMTGYNDNPNIKKMLINAKKVKTIAESAGITSVLFTGKGEPLLNESTIFNLRCLAKKFNKWPLEVQTNGLKLVKDLSLVQVLKDMGINVIAISLDHKNQFRLYKPLINKINKQNMIVRLTINVSDMLGDLTFLDLMHYCKKNKVTQLLLRKLSIPNFNIKDKTPIEWIKKHADNGKYEEMVNVMNGAISTYGRYIRTLNTGEKVYDLRGVSVVSINYCIQEENNGTNIRSLIFHEDGHLYTAWNSKSSILF